MGDIVLTSPVIRCLRSQLSDLELHVLTKEAFAGVYTVNPYIDKVFTIKDELGEVVPLLKAERYDRIIDLHRNLRSFGLWLRLRRPRSVFPKLNLRKWLLVRLHLDLMPEVHVVDRYFRAVRRLGVENDGLGLEFFIAPEDEMDLHELPSDYHEGFVAMVTGGKHATKILPAPKAAEVIRVLERPVLLLGGSEDYARAEEIIRLTDGRVFNGCGRYSLGQSASLLRMADAVITNDTGLMHIASAFRKRTVSVPLSARDRGPGVPCRGEGLEMPALQQDRLRPLPAGAFPLYGGSGYRHYRRSGPLTIDFANCFSTIEGLMSLWLGLNALGQRR